ncbi:MAG: hypothetical protein ACI9GM_000753 [Salibacteraceae bacterium]|jgi:hypothetical protein
MGTREKLFRQKLANQIETLLTNSEKVFSTDKLDKKWLKTMLKETQKLTSALTIYQFLHELPENTKLQVAFLELDEQEVSKEKPQTPSYGDEILKEIDEFESHEAEEVFVTEELKERVEIVKADFQEKKSPAETQPENTPIEATIIPEKEVEPKAAEAAIEESKVSIKQEKAETSTKEVPEKENITEINDSMALSETSLADKLRSKSIKKLADSIALNERFLFSNELFNGNMEAFKRALNELDHIASKEDAKRYIALQLQVENNWKMESDTVQSFITLVERRFN